MMEIILVIVSCIILFYSFQNFKKVHTINQQIDKENNELLNKNNELKSVNVALLHKKEYISNEIEESIDKLDSLNQSIEKDLENSKQLSQKAFENYFQILEKAYEDADKQYDKNIETLNHNFENQKKEMKSEIAAIQKDLESIRATRAAAIQAKNKEKEIKEKNKFYMLTPSKNDIDDIQKLERVKKELHSPRILSMLIWSTFFQKPMNNLCNNILGTAAVTGIYKITNQNNDMCYIGQSVDIATRWKSHAKCGLGIDTPQRNKLYKAMQDDGIWNFSWELIEKCPKDQLDEKEKFYIELYQSKNFGYNTTKGNS